MLTSTPLRRTTIRPGLFKANHVPLRFSAPESVEYGILLLPLVPFAHRCAMRNTADRVSYTRLALNPWASAFTHGREVNLRIGE
jgi:hypothetical protein